ncbi:HET-domain-containing protein [Staphylotrichum tortipilum]|uniref:HET-domain-containing protein n=1 Tax=Staphylotrichum tortipilum TaxID=2831512 RepID=A0AAN6MTA3_9PEZI|nr:HET-domain-containing protein [Staphylotrichum longicolle]
MDYTNLPIGVRQIRLITLCPPAAGDSSPVECTMVVRSAPLPTNITDNMASVPSTTINFDPCVARPPPESFVESLRQTIAPALEALDTHLTGVPGVEPLLMFPTHMIPDMLSPEDRNRVMSEATDNYGRGWRLWGSWGDTRAYEDEAGPAISIADHTPPEHMGTLDVAHLNPFLRPPNRSRTAYQAYLEQTIKPDTYIALSYAWGPPSPTTPVTINGTTVPVRSNLAAALRQLRTMPYFLAGGQIWIDAICINQSCPTEKPAQISLMASIYHHAANILVWLGPSTPSSNAAITYLERLSTEYRTEYLEALDPSPHALTSTTWRAVAAVRMETLYRRLRAVHLVDVDDPASRAARALKAAAAPLREFFARPYWRRLWIIQELCAGRGGMPVVCGERVTQWRYVRDGTLRVTAIGDLLKEVSGSGEDAMEHVAQVAQLEVMGHRRRLGEVDEGELAVVVQNGKEGGPLMGGGMRRAIVLAAGAECAVPHDRVYGMLNVPGLPEMGVKVDYGKKVEEVFEEFTAGCVRHETMDFLALLDGRDLRVGGGKGTRPSWVPDYAAASVKRIGILDGEWSAGGFVPTSWGSPDVVGKTLRCRGKVVGSVDGVGAVSSADIEFGGVEDSPFTGITQSGAFHSNTEAVEATLYKVLVGGCDMNGTEAPASFKCLYSAFPIDEPPKTSTFYRTWHFLNSNANLLLHGRPLSSYFTHFSPSTTSPSPPLPPLTKLSTAAARQAMESRTKLRRLIVTTSGHIGLAPAYTRPGDAVISIVGHGKPVIARKARTVGIQEYWNVVGEAYIQGMMDAEMMPLSVKLWHGEETLATLAGAQELWFV